MLSNRNLPTHFLLAPRPTKGAEVHAATGLFPVQTQLLSILAAFKYAAVRREGTRM